MSLAWDLPSPYVHAVTAGTADIDAYRHVNNAVYVRWLDEAAWAHSSALGLPPETCTDGRRGMAVWRTQLNYVGAAFEHDQLLVGTWILGQDGRLRVDRRFQIIRPADGQTLLRGLVHYVCIDLASGKARRMPPEFIECYRPLPEVALALQQDMHRPFAPGVEPARAAPPDPGLP